MPKKTNTIPKKWYDIMVSPKNKKAKMVPKIGIRWVNCPVFSAPISKMPLFQNKNDKIEGNITINKMMSECL